MKPLFKYILPLVTAALIMFAFAFATSLAEIRSEAVSYADQDMEHRIQTFWELLRKKGEPFRIVHGRLLAGDYVINGNYELPDRIRDIFGGTATIFMGDMRVSTNVMKDDGSRAVGTRLQGAAREAIFTRGVSYRGSADILGKHYFTAYDPIRGQDGGIIGVLYVGIEQSAFIAHYDKLRNKIIAIICGVIVLSLVFALFFLRQGWNAKAALVEHQHRLADIINFLPDATWAIDTTGTVIAWNKASAELTGVKSEDIIGRNNFEYSVPFYGERRPILVDVAITPNPEQERKYVSFSRKNDTVEAEIFVPHFRPGGMFLWARARHLLDAAGNVIGAIETIRDITEQKRLQEVMMQTEKMVMVGGLAAGMAHEINNPLGAILQNIQNIQRRTSDGLAANDRIAAEIGLDFDKMQRYLKQRGIFDLLEMISAAGTRAASIVAKMLSFSHKSTAILEPVCLDQLINQSLDLAACDYDLKKQYDFRTIQITRTYDRNIPEIVVNRAEIEQALINLIKNAVQSLAPAVAGHTPQIAVRTLLNGSCATIEIEDNGSGMSPEVSRRIFDPFFTTKTIGIGTGLGLAVTYALVVKNHHGSIAVDSTPGKGSKFTVNLPLQERGSV